MKTVYIQVILFLMFFIDVSINAQVYNYDPIRHTNFETNPAYLATDKYRNMASFIQQGIPFASNKFYQETLKLSMYSQKYFLGLGLVSSFTHVNDTTNYSYVGIGAAYRTVLFNRVHTKIGLLYKFMNSISPPGNFNYYSFTTSGEEKSKQQINQNVNASISFSSARDKYYLSFGILNYHSPQQSSVASSFFPQYYFVNVGDFARILDLGNCEISYTAFVKKYDGQKNLPVSQYIIFLKGFPVSRRSGIKYGARAGITDDTYLQYSPMLSYYRKKFSCNFLLDMGYNTTTNKTPFKPNAQFNLTYLF